MSETQYQRSSIFRVRPESSDAIDIRAVKLVASSGSPWPALCDAQHVLGNVGAMYGQKARGGGGGGGVQGSERHLAKVVSMTAQGSGAWGLGFRV